LWPASTAFSGLHGEVLAELDTAPTLDNRIEACADDIDAWEEDSLHGDDEGHQRSPPGASWSIRN
jgi:hypothetical protein